MKNLETLRRALHSAEGQAATRQELDLTTIMARGRRLRMRRRVTAAGGTVCLAGLVVVIAVGTAHLMRPSLPVPQQPLAPGAVTRTAPHATRAVKAPRPSATQLIRPTAVPSPVVATPTAVPSAAATATARGPSTAVGPVPPTPTTTSSDATGPVSTATGAATPSAAGTSSPFP